MEIFRDQEQAYFEWIEANRMGYVLNARKKPNENYLVIHLATCQHIAGHAINQAENAFTGQKFIKVCALDLDEIRVWVSAFSANGFSKVCSACNPDVGTTDSRVPLSRQAEDEGSVHPKAYLRLSLVYMRDSKVVETTLKRASGICERCHQPAPFKRQTNNEPYLEVHHTIPLSEGGPDTIDNTEGLCPNCHREAHFG